MIFKNTPTKFGLIAKSFHWVIATLILCLLIIGYTMAGMEASPDKIWLVTLHKSFGVLVLMLIGARLGWRLINPPPAPEAGQKAWEQKLAALVHCLIYAAVFALPLSGWIMSSAGQYPVSFFGLFSLPQIVPKDREIMYLAREIHEVMATVIMVLLALHFSGAAKHHVLDRDNTLRRMTSDRLGWKGGIALLAVLGALFLTPLFVGGEEGEDGPQQQAAQQQIQSPQETSDAAQWVVDTSASSIKFEVTQSGQPFTGEFKNFTAAIVFDPGNLAASHVDVQIPIAQMTTGSSDRDRQAASADWFDALNFPVAIFSAESFEKKEANQYVAHGTLTIRGVAKAVDLPFTLDIHETNSWKENGPLGEIPGQKYAEMKSEITLNRLDFGIGQGAWQKTDTIADAVKISIYVKANQPQQ